MAYTRSWNEAYPTGSLDAHTLDTLIQEAKTDLRERVADLHGMSSAQFAADPIAADRWRQRTPIWTKTDVGASQAAVEMTDGGARFIALRGGSVTGVVVTLGPSQVRTAGTLTVTVWKSVIHPTTGVRTETAQSLTAVLNGTNTAFKITTAAKDTITFAAGDEIFVKIATDASWTPTTNSVRACVEVHC